jgi:hypothetical protein
LIINNLQTGLTVDNFPYSNGLFFPFSAFMVTFLEINIHTTHKSRFRHRESVIYLVSLCQQVFSLSEQTGKFTKFVTAGQIPQYKILLFLTSGID